MTIESLLSGLTTNEKLEAMDFLWRDLSKSAIDFPSPAWHERVLAERMANPSPKPAMPLKDAIADVRERLNARRAEE